MRRQPSRARPGISARTGVLLASVAVMVAGAGAWAVDAVAAATRPGTVTLCMASRDRARPYTQATVDGTLIAWRGRGQSTGPVFSAGLPVGQGWGDIIPPFTSATGVRFGGQNWSAAGRAVHAAGCVVPAAASPAPTAAPPPPPPTTRRSGPAAPTTTAPRPASTTTTTVPASTTAPTSTSPPTTTAQPTTPGAIALAAPPADDDAAPGLPTVLGGLLIVAGGGVLVVQRLVR